MGCGASLTDIEFPGSQKRISGLSKDEPEIRSPSHVSGTSKATRTRVSDTLTLHYAVISQRGYYPDAPDKPNQDAFTVIPNFNEDKNQFYCGVFDGHGANGDACAKFARKECPECMKRFQKKKTLSPLEAYYKSFEDANARLHASIIDDSGSGTTAICMLLENETAHIANVGDSRAVLATFSDGKLVAQALSVDQTPYRTDERNRVVRAGARIMTMDQLEGIAPLHENWSEKLNGELDEEGDPPRVWSPFGPFPGTAFTRSIGDEIAEGLGVIAAPEITSIHISRDDVFIVIASDGVFEFLTSQAVVDLIKSCEDPYVACEKVVAESYRLWLTYELRTDDITIICVYFEFDAVADRRQSRGRAASDTLTSNQIRPVRKGMRTETRRAQMRKDMAELVKEEDIAYRVDDHAIPKSLNEMEVLEKITAGNWLFRHLTQRQRADIYAVMERIEVVKHQVVIQQGDAGDRFYIVESGQYQVSVQNDKAASVVHTYTESMEQEARHASFGELALMHDAPRTSSVSALSPGVLWAIDCRAFRRVFIKAPTPVLIQTLQNVDILKTVSYAQLECLANNLTEVTFQDGEYIIRQGDIGNTFYVIKEGIVSCTIVEVDAITRKKESRQVLRLKENQYFGERALLKEAPRAANVISVGRTKLLRIARREFEQILGSLQEMIDSDSRQREARDVFETAVKQLRQAHHQPQDSIIASSDMQDFRFRYLLQNNGWNYLAVYQQQPQRRRYITVQVFALKHISIEKKAEFSNNMVMHRALHSRTPLITSIQKTWKDSSGFYVAFDAVVVGNLSTLIGESFLSEDIARVYAAQALFALEFIHNAGHVYRNLTVNNILVDMDGYLRFHDLHLMKKLSEDARTYTICGTAEYMAPEMVSACGHNSSVDIWALGVSIFEMLCGETPFAVDSHDMSDNDITMAVYSKISRHNKEDLRFPRDDLTPQAQDLIRMLLDPIAQTRFGCQARISVEKGGSEIRAHPWFDGIDWVQLAAETLEMPHSSNAFKEMQEQTPRTLQPDFEPCRDDIDWLEDF
uniref:cGMP-dependent protein kinase n=1 Tax=Albugo laibachii Nc14 TaxID=890382 RepID=F0WDG5_9STRA|nr:cGMPdependent protein kinase putative [Albugo laibachii Nc14]|eukprot:CCA19237.1 cGMPdependent protein kinase putative [Albugo laibachii Nc14]